MTQSIFDSVAAHGSLRVEPLRTGGTGFPLFCFPGAEFRELTAVLPEGPPVYGVDIDSSWEIEQEFTVEQLAVFYLGVIREIQKTGPYFLCGYSFGGLVAYEIAVRLADEGDSVALVALLDTPNPALTSNLSANEAVQFHKTYLIDRIKKYYYMLVRCDFRQMMRSGLVFMVSRFGSFFLPAVKVGFRVVNRPLPPMFETHDPTTVFLKAWRSYVPRHYANSVVVIRMQDRGPEYDHDPSMGWDTCAIGGVQVHIVPGTHADMMSMPYVCGVAQNLAAYLDNDSNRKE